MKKENFIAALPKLTPGCTPKAAEMWTVFAKENVDSEQFVGFADSNPNGADAAIEDWLDAIYAGIGLIKQRFNDEVALQITSLADIPCCLYPHEMYDAAKHLQSGGSPESIPDMATEGSLDTVDETVWPIHPKPGMLADSGDIIAKATADHIVRTGTENTFSGNYIMGFGEIAEHFGTTESCIAGMQDSVIVELEGRVEVANVQMDGDAFDVCYYLDYCPKYEEPDEDAPFDMHCV